MRHKRGVLMILLVLAVFIGGIGFAFQAQNRQYARNRQLIAALVRGDDRAALVLVNQGADPNTRYKPPPPPSLPQMIKQLMRWAAPPTNDSPTALSICCGAPWNSDHATNQAQRHAPDPSQLVQAMLSHSANFNAQDRDRATPLYWAVFRNHRNTIGVLLDHGDNVDSNTIAGVTPLMFAVRVNRDPETVRLLLQHGANVNAQDQEGWTPLYHAVRFAPKLPNDSALADIMRQLLAHGARPNLPNKQGDTALKLAQRAKRADLLSLLQQAGAPK